ncbi:MAG: hypothetical protein ACTS3T_00645 [Almyronema sp.]
MALSPLSRWHLRQWLAQLATATAPASGKTLRVQVNWRTEVSEYQRLPQSYLTVVEADADTSPPPSA